MISHFYQPGSQLARAGVRPCTISKHHLFVQDDRGSPVAITEEALGWAWETWLRLRCTVTALARPQGGRGSPTRLLLPGRWLLAQKETFTSSCLGGSLASV